MARKLYKVYFSGYFLTYADSPEEAEWLYVDDPDNEKEIQFSTMRNDSSELMENGCTVPWIGKETIHFDGEESES